MVGIVAWITAGGIRRLQNHGLRNPRSSDPDLALFRSLDTCENAGTALYRLATVCLRATTVSMVERASFGRWYDSSSAG